MDKTLIAKYLDSKETMTEEEWESFIEYLKSDPDFLSYLQSQIEMDTYLDSHYNQNHNELFTKIRSAIEKDNTIDEIIDDLFHNPIEKEFEPLPKKTKKNNSILLLMTLAASITLVFALSFYLTDKEHQQMPVAKLHEVGADCHIIRADEKIKAKEGMEIWANDIIETPSESTVKIKYLDDRSVITLNGSSKLKVWTENQAKRAFLETGSIICNIDKQSDDKKMLINTKHGDAKIIGTIFQLRTSETDTRLEVSEGKVELQSEEGDRLIIKSGYLARMNLNKGPKLVLYDNRTMLFEDDFDNAECSFRKWSFSKCMKKKAIFREDKVLIPAMMAFCFQQDPDNSELRKYQMTTRKMFMPPFQISMDVHLSDQLDGNCFIKLFQQKKSDSMLSFKRHEDSLSFSDIKGESNTEICKIVNSYPTNERWRLMIYEQSYKFYINEVLLIEGVINNPSDVYKVGIGKSFDQGLEKQDFASFDNVKIEKIHP